MYVRERNTLRAHDERKGTVSRRSDDVALANDVGIRARDTKADEMASLVNEFMKR